jgi:hypothetical protein
MPFIAILISTSKNPCSFLLWLILYTLSSQHCVGCISKVLVVVFSFHYILGTFWLSPTPCSSMTHCLFNSVFSLHVFQVFLFCWILVLFHMIWPSTGSSFKYLYLVFVERSMGWWKECIMQYMDEISCRCPLSPLDLVCLLTLMVLSRILLVCLNNSWEFYIKISHYWPEV